LDFLTFEGAADGMSRNAGKEPQIYAA